MSLFPLYNSEQTFRLLKDSGEEFIEKFLYPYSNREDYTDFQWRKKVSYNPAYARSAVVDIKNSIHERLLDVKRLGGPKSYQQAIKGEMGGVDLDGNSLNSYISRRILPELLFMGRVGIYVDREPILDEDDRATVKNPYFTLFKTEQITGIKYNLQRQIIKLRLEEETAKEDADGFPTNEKVKKTRLLTLVENGVRLEVRDHDTDKVTVELLNLPMIPFAIVELSESLLKDVAKIQIAILNLESSALHYALKSNFPFYVEQVDMRSGSAFVKSALDIDDDLLSDETVTSSNTDGEKADTQDKVATIGATAGRQYQRGLDAPQFIHPSPEPLKATLKFSERLEQHVRKLVNLNLSQIRSVSAEAVRSEQRGKNSGIANIGVELLHAEIKLAQIWSAYEKTTDTAKIIYPKTWELRSPEDRNKEAESLEDALPKLPSKIYQKEIAKKVANLRLKEFVSDERLSEIESEIDSANVIAIDPKVLREDFEIGLVDGKTTSEARLYPKGSYEKAKKDHAERLKRIQEAQTSPNEAARGLDDQDPGTDPKIEKEGKPKRGENK